MQDNVYVSRFPFRIQRNVAYFYARSDKPVFHSFDYDFVIVAEFHTDTAVFRRSVNKPVSERITQTAYVILVGEHDVFVFKRKALRQRCGSKSVSTAEPFVIDAVSLVS